jgi:membrane protease YdiL (CAAX protease family)
MALAKPLAVAILVLGLVVAASATLSDAYVTTIVSFVFLGATYAMVLRRDDDAVRHHGLAMGGLVAPDQDSMSATAARALAWALTCALVVFVPFYFGWRAFWHVRTPFALHGSGSAIVAELAREFAAQLVMVALPEEAFFRGYLQTAIDDALPVRLRWLGLAIGPGILISSVLFALGHLATVPTPGRLAVFFPSLLFGLLRLRTGGIGASVLFHAMCNVFSATLGKGFGVY